MTHTTDTRVAGVDRHRDRYRVRKSFPGYGRIVEFYDSLDEAKFAAVELERRRKAGLPPRDADRDDPSLAELAARLLEQKASRVSPKTGRRLRPRSLEWWGRIVDPWAEGPLGRLGVSQLRRARVEDELAALAVSAVPEANNRLVGIKALLRLAEARGASIDSSILALAEFPHRPRARRALSAEELRFLAPRAPEHGRRALLFAGTVGMRWREVMTLTDARFDFAARTVFVPAGLCKEAADKTIDLTPAEALLVREQQLARAPGAATIFARVKGGSWAPDYGGWHRDVWAKAVRRAAAAWRERDGLDPAAETPFQWQARDEADELLWDGDDPVLDALEPHDLRATAITLMRDAGFSREQTACRVGHADAGELIDRIYDRGDRRARADVAGAIRKLPASGLLAQPGAQRAHTPADAPGSAAKER